MSAKTYTAGKDKVPLRRMFSKLPSCVLSAQIYTHYTRKIRKCIFANRWHYWVFTQITQNAHFLERGNKFTATVKLNRELQIDP